jgi:hypothetical protein
MYSFSVERKIMIFKILESKILLPNRMVTKKEHFWVAHMKIFIWVVRCLAWSGTYKSIPLPWGNIRVFANRRKTWSRTFQIFAHRVYFWNFGLSCVYHRVWWFETRLRHYFFDQAKFRHTVLPPKK